MQQSEGVAGATTLISSGETTSKLLAGVRPKITWVAPLRFWPPIVTVVPPDRGPRSGETLFTTARPLTSVSRPTR
jgi:hypothetical protein